MTLGISSFALFWAVRSGLWTHMQLVEQALVWRVRRLQFGDNLPLDALSDTALDDLKRRADDAGLTLEAGARGLTRENAERYLAIARRLGAPLLRFVIDRGKYEPSVAEAAKVIRGLLGQLDDLAVTLAIENHDRWSAATYRQLIETLAHRRVGICLDTANSLGAGEGIAAVASTLAPFVVNLHIKDFVIRRVLNQQGFLVEGRPAGAGMLDVAALLALLRPHARCASAILELWTPPDANEEATLRREQRWVEESLAYLRKFF